MSSNRREFIEKLGATAMLGTLPLTALNPLVHEAMRSVPGGAGAAGATGAAGAAEEWDMSWLAALKGKKHRAIMDCTEVESGYGVWRASIWENQYQQALMAKPADIKTVLVLRHNAIVLAFHQDLWDHAGIGASEKVTHPITLQSTDRNPALLSSARNEVPAMFDAFALPNFIQRGGIVLACNLALDFFISGMAAKMSIPADEARKRAVAAILPGIRLMPSGVFAAVRAQEEGCQYVRAS